MKARISPLVIICSFLLLPNMAHAVAGLFVEPAITYESSTLSVTNPTTLSGDQDEKVNGPGLGIRLGMHFMDILFVAADGRFSKPRYESDALNGSADATASNLGLTLGVQTPVAGLRVWGSSVLDGALDPETINSANIKYTGFNGYRVGVGFYIAVVSLNLEYQEAKYKTAELESLGPFATSAVSNMNGTQKGYILSVSFPIAM